MVVRWLDYILFGGHRFDLAYDDRGARMGELERRPFFMVGKGLSRRRHTLALIIEEPGSPLA
jgi:hypothetical protein